MGYLGLDQTEIKDDNLFQRMFWPSDHAGEADTLGQQGFWVCVAIATVTFVPLLLQGHWIAGFLIAIFYFLGGIGVREHSQPAAILVAVTYVLGSPCKPDARTASRRPRHHRHSPAACQYSRNLYCGKMGGQGRP